MYLLYSLGYNNIISLHSRNKGGFFYLITFFSCLKPLLSLSRRTGVVVEREYKSAGQVNMRPKHYVTTRQSGNDGEGSLTVILLHSSGAGVS